MRAAAEAQPFTVGPVLQVVPRPTPGPGHVRDLVLLVPRRFEPFHRRQIHRRRVIVGRLRPLRPGHFVLEWRVGVDLEQVERQMVGSDVNRAVDRFEPVIDALPRQPHHQIKADVVEPGGACFGEGHASPVGSVKTGQASQLGLAKRLDTETETVHAGRAKGRQLRIVDAFRISFQRDLGVRRDVERVAAQGDDAGDVGRIKQRRRAAAEVDRVGRPSCPPRALDLLQQCVDVARLLRRVEQPAVEVAVVTDGRTERDVDVKAKHGIW